MRNDCSRTRRPRVNSTRYSKLKTYCRTASKPSNGMLKTELHSCQRRNQRFSAARSMVLITVQTAHLMAPTQHSTATASVQAHSASSTVAILTACPSSVTCNKAKLRYSSKVYSSQIRWRITTTTTRKVTIVQRSKNKQIMPTHRPSRSKMKSQGSRKRRATRLFRIRARTYLEDFKIYWSTRNLIPRRTSFPTRLWE